MSRYRRLRVSKTMRDFVRETVLTPADLIQPFFVVAGKNKKETIVSMPGIHRFSLDQLLKEIELFIRLGGRGGIFLGAGNVASHIGGSDRRAQHVAMRFRVSGPHAWHDLWSHSHKLRFTPGCTIQTPSRRRPSHDLVFDLGVKSAWGGGTTLLEATGPSMLIGCE